MKKCVVISALFLLILSVKITNADVKFSGIGAYTGTNLFIGDSPIELSRLSPNLGFYSIYNLSQNISLKFQIGYSKLIIETARKQIQTASLPMELSGLFRPDIGYQIKPLLQFGLGVMSFSTNGSPAYFDGLFSGGLGFESPINDRFSFLILANLTYTTGDDFNGYNDGLKDGYFSFQTGLTYNPNHRKYQRKTNTNRENIIAQNGFRGDSTYFDNLQHNTEVANLKNELEKKNLEIAELKSQLEEINRKLVSFENSLKESKKDRLAKNEKKMETKTKLASSSKSVGERYKEALHQYNRKDYNKAIEKFNNLYNSNQSHPLASNFIYWIGESYWGLNDYHNAIAAFEKVKRYANSNKLDDALLMAGLCYMKIGNLQQAKMNFTELIERFPDSEFSKKAGRYLEKIKRKIVT